MTTDFERPPGALQRASRAICLGCELERLNQAHAGLQVDLIVVCTHQPMTPAHNHTDFEDIEATHGND